VPSWRVVGWNLCLYLHRARTKLDSSNCNSNSKITIDLSCERYGKGVDAQDNHACKDQWKNKSGKNKFKMQDEVKRSTRKVQINLWRRNALHDRWQWRNSYWNWRIFRFLDLIMTFTWVSEIILGHSKFLASHNEGFYISIMCRRSTLTYTH